MKYLLNIILLLCLLLPAVLKSQENSGDKKATSNLPDGFQSINWNSLFTEVRGKVKGKIIYENEEKVIVTREGNITYRYGFFSVKPELASLMDKMAETNKPAAGQGENAAPESTGPEARFSYAVVEFPYLSMDDVRKTLTDKYGEPKIENVKDNSGAVLWESEKSVLIMWVDRYNMKPYVKKINYLSKDIAKELNRYHYVIFNKDELNALESLRK